MPAPPDRLAATRESTVLLPEDGPRAAAVPPLVPIGDTFAVSRTLSLEHIAPSPFELDSWNIANWNRGAEEQRLAHPVAGCLGVKSIRIPAFHPVSLE